MNWELIGTRRLWAFYPGAVAVLRLRCPLMIALLPLFHSC